MLTKESINQAVVRAQYAVRGLLALRAAQLEEELRKNPNAHPFDTIVYCNIGNPQQLAQPPLTFIRQVLALVECPELQKSLSDAFPADVIQRAQAITREMVSIGAYSHSKGFEFVRRNVAAFINNRDGITCANHENIFLTNGASEGISMVLKLIIASPLVGIMTPTPQYPLYSATITMLQGTVVPYPFAEETGGDWEIEIKGLRGALETARARGVDVRAICIINPGNPTGSCSTRERIGEIIRFAQEENLVILADEVYQENIYDATRPFYSFRKGIAELAAPVELFSFHSVSKGLIGECGRRGGYLDCYNIDGSVMDELYKIASVSLCPNTIGQIAVDLMVAPPLQGSPSYEKYREERSAIAASLGRRGQMLADAFNKLPGVTCIKARGALYLFPRFTFPQRFLEHAAGLHKQADELFALELLQATGICMVPGSGFGQAPGTWHVRTTFLPPEAQFPAFIARISEFYKRFIDFYN